MMNRALVATALSLGDVVERQMPTGEWRLCIVTSIYPGRSIILTPIPDGMTIEDLGRLFWPSMSEPNEMVVMAQMAAMAPPIDWES